MKLSKELIAARLKAGFVCTTEAAKLVHRTSNTIRKWCDDGKVTFERDATAYFVQIDSLWAYTGIAQQKET